MVRQITRNEHRKRYYRAGSCLLVFSGMGFGEVIPRTGVFAVPDVMPVITAEKAVLSSEG